MGPETNYKTYFKGKKITMLGLESLHAWSSSETHGFPTGFALPSFTGK
jgi:hypothetical protein